MRGYITRIAVTVTTAEPVFHYGTAAAPVRSVFHHRASLLPTTSATAATLFHSAFPRLVFEMGDEVRHLGRI